MIPPNAGFVNNAIKTCVVEYSINSSLLILSLSLHHKRKTDGKVLSPLSAYIFLIFNAANRPQRSSTCSTNRSNARIPPPPLLCNFQSVCLPYAPRKKTVQIFCEQPCACCAATISRGVFNHSRGNRYSHII